MEDIVLERTVKTPAVRFSFTDNRLEIVGVSIPEDADNFYAPLMEWVDNYIDLKINQRTTVVLKLIYFNTSTSDYLVTMLKNLKKIQPEPSQTYLYEESVPELDENSTAAQNGQHVQESGFDNPDILRLDSLAIENEEPAEELEKEEQDKSEETNKGHLLRIEWHYEEEDEDMRETGSHFESIIDLPFVFQSCEEIE